MKLTIDPDLIVNSTDYDIREYSARQLSQERFIVGHYSAAALTGYDVNYLRQLNGSRNKHLRFPTPVAWIHRLPIWKTDDLIRWCEGRIHK